MDIKNKLRKALLKEGDNKRNKYGCVMVYLGVEKDDWKELQDLIEDEDLYLPDGEEGFYGRENNPHVTILFGLHNDIPDKDIEVEIDKIKNPKLKLGKVSTFTNDKFEVLKFDIVSEDLHKLNKKFAEFPHTTDFPDYHPHCTIAYVNKGSGDKYIKKLNDLDKIEVVTDKIVYSRANGKKTDYKLK